MTRQIITDKKTVLITRSAEQSGDLSKTLIDKGFEPICSPLLSFESLPFECPDIDIYDAVMFTSQNAVKAWCSNIDNANWLEKTVYAVGRATANVLTEHKFKNIIAGNNGIEELLSIVENDKGIQSILYPCAEEISKDLSAIGIQTLQIQKLVVYRMRMIDMFSDEVLNAFKHNKIDYVTLMSRRTAKAFEAVIRRHDLVENLHNMTAIVISKAVGDSITSLPWQAVRIAKNPDMTAMVKAIVDN